MCRCILFVHVYVLVSSCLDSSNLDIIPLPNPNDSTPNQPRTALIKISVSRKSSAYQPEQLSVVTKAEPSRRGPSEAGDAGDASNQPTSLQS